jgi:hypothetical protein
MKAFAVSYDLIKRKDYPELWGAFGAYTRLHLLGSTWIILSNDTAYDIATALMKHIDGDDKMIVSELVHNGSAWSMSFSEEIRNWLKANI